MAEKTVKSRIQVKRGTSAEWALATNFVPKEGEIIFYSDLNKMKIGDGSTLVSSLPFLHVDKSEIDNWSHNHDDKYYTESEVDTKLSGKAASSHVHGNIANGGTLSAANMVVVTDSNKKITTSSTISTTELGYLDGVTSKIQDQLNGKSATGHTHDDRYYTESESDARFAPTGHTHTTTIAASSGANELTLAHGTKYSITAGGDSFVFTMPSDTNTWRPVGTGATDAAAGNHTHDGRYYTESESDSRFAPISHTHSYLGKTTYEWNKEFAAGQNGAISLGRYNMYDTQLTFDITSTTTQSLSGKLVIATQNGNLCQARVFGDATGTLASKLIIYQSPISGSRSWIEVFCNFDGWSKNKVNIYAVALNSATVEKQMTSVTISNGVPAAANVTSGDTKWSGTIINDLATTFASKGTQTGAAGTGTTGAATGNTANSSALTSGAAGTGNTGASGTGNTGTPSATTTINNYTMSFSNGVLTITSGTATVASSTHTHTGPSHTHTGPSHTHSVPAHAHGLNSHTHTGPSHTHEQK